MQLPDRFHSLTTVPGSVDGANFDHLDRLRMESLLDGRLMPRIDALR